MKGKEKTKEQLQNELAKLRQKIVELKAQKKSVKSEEIYRLIAENTSDVVTLQDFNLQTKYRYISPSIKDATGYKPEELVGKSPFDFIHPDDKKKLLPILTKYVTAKFKKLFAGKESKITERIEFRFKEKGGNWRYVQSTGNIIGNQLLFVSRDITEIKKAEEALQQSQQKFASLFKNSPEALVYLDKNSNIVNINPRFTELFGYTLEEVKGKNINDGMIHPPDKIEEGKNLDKTALSKGYFNYETVRKKKDGTCFPVSVSGSDIVIGRQIKGIIGTYIDITERKKMEEELQKLARYDTLTNCYSRGYGLALLEQQIKIANRKKNPILLSYLDVDNLKDINDTFGHGEGDEALKEVAQFFKSILREADIVCRIGGDEFMLILPDNSLDDEPLIKERVNKKLKELNKNLNKPYKISFSIGFSVYDPTNPASIEKLIKTADEKMYEEKKEIREDYKLTQKENYN
ncbi:MAG: PAS domain S-box protein [Caldisericota bacterium]|nr:PAS domain S-box protein [Caldisericota bacterium]